MSKKGINHRYKLYTVKCTYHHFKNKKMFERVPFLFNDARYLPLGTFNVLIIQTVFVLVGQQCLQIVKLESLITQTPAEWNQNIKHHFFMIWSLE